MFCVLMIPENVILVTKIPSLAWTSIGTKLDVKVYKPTFKN